MTARVLQLNFNTVPPTIYNAPDSTIIGAYYKIKNHTTSTKHLTWGELKGMIAAPMKTVKADSAIVVPTLASKKLKEKIYEYEAVNGSAMSALWVDIDEGSPTLDSLIKLTEQLGVCAAIYSSSSSRREKGGVVCGDRWRIMIPVARPMTTDEWKLRQKSLAKYYGGGLEAARISQPIYLPTNPDAGFYAGKIVEGELWVPECDPLAISPVMEQIQLLEEEAAKQASDRAKKAPIAKRIGGIDDSVIDRVRTNYTMREVLESYGYERDGRRYIHPKSTSGTAGVVIFNSNGTEYYYSHHGNDPLADGHTHDVFDLIMHHEYNGDIKAAIKGCADKVFSEVEKKQQIDEWKKQKQEEEQALIEQVKAEHKESLFVSAQDQLDSPIQIDYLIRKIIEYGTTNVLFGPTGGGKSFVAIDMACSIVTGRPWNGNRIARQGAVLVLAGEGRGGIVRRLKAWCNYNEVEARQLKDLYISRHTLMMDGSNIDEICNEMNGKDVVLVIIDTLNRHLDGDENTTKDMSAFVKHVDTLRDRLDSTMMVVHHPGKGDQTVGRGNSSLKAALDGEILCNKGVLEWTKTKDMETPNNIEFKLHQVKIGVDEEGVDITSCVPQYGERADKHDDMTAMERVAIEALVKAAARTGIHHNGMWGALIGDWKLEFADVRTRHKQDDEAEPTRAAIDKSFGRTKDGLIKKGVVEAAGNIMIPKRIDHQEDITTFMSMPFAMKIR